MQLQCPRQLDDASRYNGKVAGKVCVVTPPFHQNHFKLLRASVLIAHAGASRSKPAGSASAGATAAAAQPRAVDPTVPPHPLLDWVKDHKGYVHPALAIVDDAPCGCRGVIATMDITVPVPQQRDYHHHHHHHQQQQQQQQRQQQQQHGDPNTLSSHAAASALRNGSNALQPGTVLLLAVPERLYMTSVDAVDILGSAIRQQQQQQQCKQQQPKQTHSSASTGPAAAAAAAGSTSFGFQQLWSGLNTLLPVFGKLEQQRQQQQLAASLSKLQPVLLLALLLAWERKKGDMSFWYPYISTLPDKPPCAWFPALQLLQQQQQQQQQTQAQGSTAAAAAAAVLAKCSAAVSLYGPALGSRITTDDVVWAYGQVVSRAFGCGTAIGLAPLIDMCNHKAGAGTPQPLAAAAAAAAAGDWRVSIAHLQQQQQQQQQQQHFWCIYGTARQEQQQQHHHHHMPPGRHVVLAAGEELYISYMEKCDAASAWLNFGFVPPE